MCLGEFVNMIPPRYYAVPVVQTWITDANLIRQSLRDYTMAFRPNLVISGSVPFEEDLWDGLWIGEHKFMVISTMTSLSCLSVFLIMVSFNQRTRHCSRCKVICVDPETAKVNPEPLRTLATYRREKVRSKRLTVVTVRFSNSCDHRFRDKYFLGYSCLADHRDPGNG